MTELVSLQEVAERTVELVRCTSAGKSVELREQYPNEPLHVRGSSARLGQIFLSLLVNAQQALPDGGTVTVQLERDGDWAVARVTDTGRASTRMRGPACSSRSRPRRTAERASGSPRASRSHAVTAAT